MAPIERTPPPSRDDKLAPKVGKIDQNPMGPQIGPQEFIPPLPKVEPNKPILKAGSNRN